MAPEDVIREIGTIHPAFEKLMSSFSDHNSLTEFLENHEVLAAFERLQDFLKERKGAPEKSSGLLQLLATDGASRFARVGGWFLGTELTADDVGLVDL